MITTIATVLTAGGIVALIWGALQKRKAGRIASAPFATTGDVAARGEAAAGPKGAVSVEGETRCAEPLISPVTGTACLYYELDVIGTWKSGDVEKKAEYVKERGAANFAVDDGSGPVAVLAEQGGDFELAKTFEETKKEGFFADLKSAVGKGEPVMFGQYAFENPPMSKANKFTCTEKIVPVTPRLYVCGKVQGKAIGSPGWSALIMSSKSRDELLGGAARTARLCLIGGGASAALGVVVGVVSKLLA